MIETENGQEWGCGEEPDMSKWETDLAFRLAPG
jgi:hypothetical protein